jgi:hypothetical protein
MNKLLKLFVLTLGVCLGLSTHVQAAQSLTQYGITWTFSEDRPTGQFANGDYWVVGPVTITDINPKTGDGGIDYSSGSMLNPVPGEGGGEGWVTRADFEKAFPNGGAIFDDLKDFGWDGANPARFFEQPVVGNRAKSIGLGYHPDGYLNTKYPAQKAAIIKVLRPNTQGLHRSGLPYGTPITGGGIETTDSPPYDSDKNISLHLPYVVPAGNSIYSTVLNPLMWGTCDLDANGNEIQNGPIDPVTGKGLYGCFRSNGEKTWFKETAVLTVLASAPPAGSFRPPYAGNNDKTVRWNKSDMNYSALNSLAIPVPSNAPDLAWLEEATKRPLIEMNYNFTNSNWKASWGGNYPDSYPRRTYGREVAGIASGAGLLLNTNLSNAQKERLLINMVQWGIDIHGLVNAGMIWRPNGGHNHGRVLPIFIAAKVLGDAAILANASGAKTFQEMINHAFVTQDVINMPRAPHDPPFKPYTQDMLGMPEWSSSGQYSNSTSSAWQSDGTWYGVPYRHNVGGAGCGTVATILLMGGRAEINQEAFMRYHMERYYPLQRPGGNGAFNANSNDIQPFTRDMWDVHINGGVISPPVVTVPTANTPSFSPAGGQYDNATLVTLSSALSGATIYYSLDGSDPKSLGKFYSAPFTIDATSTLKAIAIKSGYIDSNIAVATYTIGRAVVSVAISPNGGSFTSAQNVTLATSTVGAEIRYTIDGSAPSASSLLYNGPISVASSQTIKAIGIKAGMTNSAVTSAAFTINIPLPVVASVVFSPNGGSFSSAQNVSLATSTVGAEIRYTVDGSVPSASSLLYSVPISVGSSQTIKAIGIKAGMTNSAVSSATFNITIPQSVVAAPVISPAKGTYYSAQTITMTSATVGAEIRYTLNGTTPTASSMLYRGPFVISSSKTIKAIALKSGMMKSNITTITIKIPKVKGLRVL